jgi:hypothetical protein
MCGGHGSVNPEHICVCGRPGIRQVGDEIICHDDDCEKRVLEVKVPDTRPMTQQALEMLGVESEEEYILNWHKWVC